MCEKAGAAQRIFFRLLLTGKDNTTYDITRCLMFAGVASLILFSGWDVLRGGHAFDPVGYSMGLTGLLFGGAGGIALKAKTEPDPPAAEEQKEGCGDGRFV